MANHESTAAHRAHVQHRHPAGGPQLAERVIDPVCGMTIDPATAKGGSYDHRGTTYFFCSAKCREKFAANPEQYLTDGARPESAPLAARDKETRATAWVCPMDPDVRQDHPGNCPRCGMALEPEVPTVATRVEYVCPMHPEIVRNEPGSCPICGMALEPRTVTSRTHPTRSSAA